MQDVQEQNQSSDRINVVPTNTISVGVPTLPPGGQNVADDLVRDACIVLAALAIAVLALVRDLPLPAMLFIVVIFIASIFVGWNHRRHVAERKQYEERLFAMTMELGEKNKTLKELIQIDPLTEVLNRRGLERALTLEMSRARRQGTKLFAMLIDCDDFKQVNDRFGHAVGDVVLQQLAKSIVVSIRVTDYASRIGGDEFVVLLVDLSHEDVAMVAERVRLNIADASVVCGETNLKCTVSVGVTQLPPEICSIEEVLNLTRTALKNSKSSGKNRITVSSVLKPTTTQLVTRSDLSTMVQTLVGGKGLRSVRQPIYNLVDQRVRGYEILTRGPRGPFETPYDLFRLARENDVLTALDMRCFKLALSFANLSVDGLPYHLNLFPGTLLDIPLGGLGDLFGDTTVPLVVEITEQQSFGDVSCLLPHIRQLKERGIKIALDDVGQSGSSLESLLVLEADIIKIHPQLTKGCAKDSEKFRQIERLLAIATSINTEAIAEGIETREDLEALVSIGVTGGQGWLWGFPKELEPGTVPDSVPCESSATS
jgi:diguanylate cyclase (GGDEF)-like protein